MILVQRDGCTEQNIADFLTLPFENKVVFAADRHDGIDEIVCIPNTKTDNQEVDLTGYKSKITGKRFIDDFDYVSWLNQ